MIGWTSRPRSSIGSETIPASRSPARTASTTSDGVQADDAHAHARMAAAELGDEVDARVVAGGPPRPEGGRAAAQLAHGDDRVARRLGRVQRPLGVRAQRVPGLGRLQPAADALEEPDAELGLEPAHLLGERRLREMELLGGRRERAVPEGREEVLELL